MAFREAELREYEEQLTAFLDARRPPEEMRDKLDIGARIQKQTMVIFEIREDWRDPTQRMERSVAKATYVRTQDIWKVYWLRHNGWNLYATAETFEDVLEMIGEDQYGCFWG